MLSLGIEPMSLVFQHHALLLSYNNAVAWEYAALNIATVFPPDQTHCWNIKDVYTTLHLYILGSLSSVLVTLWEEQLILCLKWSGIFQGLFFFIYFWCEALDSFREAWWLNLEHFMKRDLTSHQVLKQWTKVSVSITRHLLLTNSQKSWIKNHRYIHKCLISSCFYRPLYISQIGAINTISIRVCEHLRTRCLL